MLEVIEERRAANPTSRRCYSCTAPGVGTSISWGSSRTTDTGLGPVLGSVFVREAPGYCWPRDANSAFAGPPTRPAPDPTRCAPA